MALKSSRQYNTSLYIISECADEADDSETVFVTNMLKSFSDNSFVANVFETISDNFFVFVFNKI